MTAFSELGLSEAALAAVERMGYDDATPVQEQSIPYILEGRDVIAAASTGTGKTAAFLLPTLSTLERKKGRGRAPRVCVVSPTRELAQQISRTCMQISRKTGHFVTTVYGGTPYGPQIRELRGGTDVLIATPGRLNDLIDRGVVNLGEIQVLVLDEADRMLDMGFLPDVTKIVEKTPEDRQTLLFSATIDSSIQKNLGDLLKDPAIVEIARNGETAATVEQFIMPIANRKKQELLEAVLEAKGHERVIVFARTKNRTEDCALALENAGYHAESIHSDKTQGRRRRALENFRRGKTDILVATDVLARGIDVPEVNYVINFDLPDMAEDYVHRIGRTGRAGEEGFAISFVTRETVKTLREIEKLIGKDIPFTTIENYETDPTILEKPKGGKGRGRGNKPAGARRAGEKRFERAEREGRRPNAGERRGAGPNGEWLSDEAYRALRADRARKDGEGRGGNGGRNDDRPGRSNRGGRSFDRDNRPGRSGRGGHKFNDRGGRGGKRYDRDDRGGRGRGGNFGDRRGAGKNGEWLSDEEFRARRNAKNAQARMRKKERKNGAGGNKPYKTGNGNNKKRGGNGGGYDYSKFAK
jgi:ATP-dependent RNA helicase RhlE